MATINKTNSLKEVKVSELKEEEIAKIKGGMKVIGCECAGCATAGGSASLGDLINAG